ncbi:type IV secretory system conjugative DNA transfer family protein (plasmid) [Campylobacter jejuni]
MGTIRVYLNEYEQRQLKKLSIKRNESQSAVIRKLIAIEKYAKTLEILEKNNEINVEYLYHIAQCGNNLNQIAYHLNIGIESPSQTQNRLPKLIEELSQILNEHKEHIKNKAIKTSINKKIKRLSPDEKFYRRRKSMNDKKITPAKWVLMFITSIILGIILYLLMVKIIFKPDLLVTHQVGLQIIHNLGNPALKLKAYVAVFALILPFIVCLIWFFMPQMNLKENYGNARFAKEKDFEEMNICNDRGLILGCNIKKGIKGDEIEYIRAKMPLSALVVAPPGTGKTSGIILPNLFTVPNSTLALDIKGELYAKSAGYRKKYFNNEILLFEPFSDNNTLFFNPFDNSIVKDMNFIQMMKLADQIAGTIFVAEKGKEGDHWVTSAKTLFTFFALYNMQKHKHTSLGDLTQAPKKDYFNELNEEFGKECLIEDEDTGEVSRDYNVDTFKVFLKQVANDENLDEIVRNQARAYQTAAEQEFASIKSTYDTYMKVFTNPQVANATSKMNFRFEDLREKRITMYVVIQTEDMDILAPLVRIFIESLFKKLMSGQEN